MANNFNKVLSHTSNNNWAISIIVWIVIIVLSLNFVNNWPTTLSWKETFSARMLQPGLALVLSVLIANFFRAERWKILLSGNFDCSRRLMMVVFGWTFLLVALIPFRLGEFARPLWVRNHGGSGATGLGVIIVERATDLAIISMFLCFSVILYPVNEASIKMIAGFGVLLVFGAYVLLISFPGQVRSRLEKILAKRRGNDSKSLLSITLGKAINILSGMELVNEPGKNILNITLSLLIWSVSCIGFHAVLSSFLPGLDWHASMLLLVAVNLASVIWISPGNIGLFEFAGCFALSFYEYEPATTLPVVTGLHVIILLTVSMYGFTCRILIPYFNNHCE